MILTHSTLIGLLEAEGGFYISISTDKKGYFTVQFECALLTQKDGQLMNTCVRFLSTITQEKIPTPRWTNGGFNLSFKTFGSLNGFIRPLIQNYPLLSVKWMDSELFFEAFDIYRDTKTPRYIRLLYVLHYSFAMNWQGTTRKRSLQNLESQIECLFPNAVEFAKHKNKVILNVQRILQRSFPTLTNTPLNLEEYFIGLYIGDGSALVTYKFRQGRKPALYKEFTISLKNHPQNSQMLNLLSRELGFAWLSVPSDQTRTRVKVTNSQTIQNVIQVLLAKHKALLPVFRLKQLVAWEKCDEIRQLLAKSTLTQADRSKIRSNLIYIYYSSHTGTYRKLTIESILTKFQV